MNGLPIDSRIIDYIKQANKPFTQTELATKISYEDYHLTGRFIAPEDNERRVSESLSVMLRAKQVDYRVTIKGTKFGIRNETDWSDEAYSYD